MSTTERSRTSARRETLLGDQPGAFASARFVRITPMKARRVVDMVRGLPVDEALTLLQFAPQAASETVYKVLESAVANAETTEGLDRADLVVSVAMVDEGPTMKRWRPRAQGRATRINKRTSHITLVVQPADVLTARRRPAQEERKGCLMGQKINPNGFRLGISTDHKSRWYADKLYKSYVGEDVAIRKLLSKGMERAGISKVEIERTRDRVRVDIHTARPGHRHRSPWRRGRPHPRRAREAHRQAGPAEHPRGQEPRDRRAAGRPGCRRAARRVACSSVAPCARRCRPRCAPVPRASGSSARVASTAPRCRARSSTARAACPLHTLRADIDYGFYEARTTFGRIGVKVWIYKGEVAGTRAERQAQAAARAGAPGRGGRPGTPWRRPSEPWLARRPSGSLGPRRALRATEAPAEAPRLPRLHRAPDRRAEPHVDAPSRQAPQAAPPQADAVRPRVAPRSPSVTSASRRSRVTT